MSDKKRINQIAKETGLSNTELVATAQSLGFEVKSHSSSVTAEQAEKIIQGVKQALILLLNLLKKLLKLKLRLFQKQQKVNKRTTHVIFAWKQSVEDPSYFSRNQRKRRS